MLEMTRNDRSSEKNRNYENLRYDFEFSCWWSPAIVETTSSKFGIRDSKSADILVNALAHHGDFRIFFKHFNHGELEAVLQGSVSLDAKLTLL
jgi:hypothetical protein